LKEAQGPSYIPFYIQLQLEEAAESRKGNSVTKPEEVSGERNPSWEFYTSSIIYIEMYLNDIFM